MHAPFQAEIGRVFKGNNRMSKGDVECLLNFRVLQSAGKPTVVGRSRV